MVNEKFSTKKILIDLTNEFLCRLGSSDKKLWKTEEIREYYFTALYDLILHLIDDLEEIEKK